MNPQKHSNEQPLACLNIQQNNPELFTEISKNLDQL